MVLSENCTLDKGGSASAWELETAGVDWITCVWSDEKSARRARFRWSLWQADACLRGNYQRPWSIGGHNGSEVGGVAWAERTGSAVGQVTSALADELFAGAVGLNGRPSRIDIQATFIIPKGAKSLAARAYRATVKDRSVGRPVTARTFICGTDGGATCYLGAASSEQRVRVYDKGVQEGTHPPGIRWRIEMQARRKVARAIASEVASSSDRGSTILSLLAGECARSGFVIPRCSPQRASTKADQRLPDTLQGMRWLESSVRPTVQRLAEHLPIEQLLDVLGLSRDARPLHDGPEPRKADHGNW